jgi:hypothetical protein
MWFQCELRIHIVYKLNVIFKVKEKAKRRHEEMAAQMSAQIEEAKGKQQEMASESTAQMAAHIASHVEAAKRSHDQMEAQLVARMAAQLDETQNRHQTVLQIF